MTVMVSEQTKFKFKGYRVIKSKIDIAPSGNIKQELNVTFSGIKNDICDSVYILDLGVSVSNEDKSLGIDVEMRGFFEFDKELLEQEKGGILYRKCPGHNVSLSESLYFNIDRPVRHRTDNPPHH